ncbi:MAG: toxin-activating lysine-acyltransferase [Neomegalonema sp.]|nr:toxin-activating lysine-acyltransferase [Neomegalonema sp.]
MSKSHNKFTLEELTLLVYAPILLGQTKVIKGNGEPISALIWALLREEESRAYQKINKHAHPKNWRSGNVPTLIHVIAPFGGGPVIESRFKEEFSVKI